MRAGRISEAALATGITGVQRNRTRAEECPPSSAASNGVADIEALEERRLLASFSFASGVLTASGTTAPERFTVYRVTGPGVDEIHVRVRDLNTSTEQDSGAKTTSTVTRVVVNGNSGDDNIVVEDANDIAGGWTPFAPVLGTVAVNKPTVLNGDAGNDTIYGGSPGGLTGTPSRAASETTRYTAGAGTTRSSAATARSTTPPPTTATTTSTVGTAGTCATAATGAIP